MSEKEFWEKIDQQRDLRIWQRHDDGGWKLKDSILSHRHDEAVDDVRLVKKEGCRFILTPLKDSKAVEDKYVLIGRGWVD